MGSAPRALAALRNGLLAAVRHAGWTHIAQALRHYGAAVGRALAVLAGQVGREGGARAPRACPVSRMAGPDADFEKALLENPSY